MACGARPFGRLHRPIGERLDEHGEVEARASRAAAELVEVLPRHANALSEVFARDAGLVQPKRELGLCRSGAPSGSLWYWGPHGLLFVALRGCGRQRRCRFVVTARRARGRLGLVLQKKLKLVAVGAGGTVGTRSVSKRRWRDGKPRRVNVAMTQVGTRGFPFLHRRGSFPSALIRGDQCRWRRLATPPGWS